MTRKYFAILLIILFSNCAENGNSKQNDILNEKMMINILTDIHLSESKINKKTLSADSISSLLTKQYAYILNKNNVKPNQLQNSIDYYLNHPIEMEAIYNTILVELSKKEGLLRKQNIKK